MNTFRNYELIEEFAETVKNKSEMQANQMDGYISGMSDVDKNELSIRLAYLLEGKGMSMAEIADCYIAWCHCFMEERKHFVKTGEYRYHSYAEIAHIFRNEEYMKNYMTGLSISAYLWSIQRMNLSFFRKYCSEDLHNGGRYLEVGPGHGEYLITAVNNTDFDMYIACDISEPAVKLTRDYIDYYYSDNTNALDKIAIECKDFFEIDEDIKYDAIVISQVIEHTEDPRKFLAKARSISNKDALIYISTAINSPLRDHIWHFRSREEVVKMVIDSGFEIIDEFMATSDGITLEKAVRKKYDIEIGFILR